jgi:hypothetical protein
LFLDVLGVSQSLSLDMSGHLNVTWAVPKFAVGISIAIGLHNDTLETIISSYPIATVVIIQHE